MKIEQNIKAELHGNEVLVLKKILGKMTINIMETLELTREEQKITDEMYHDMDDLD